MVFENAPGSPCHLTASAPIGRRPLGQQRCVHASPLCRRRRCRRRRSRSSFAAASTPSHHTVATNSTTSAQVARMRKYAVGQLPCVRFGSTETCLQVMGTPLTLSVDQRMVAFQRGWSNKINDVDQPGYYIGGLPKDTIPPHPAASNPVSTLRPRAQRPHRSADR